MQQRSDEQLVLLILNGDQAAFEILVHRYEKQVFALAFRLSGDYDEAQDLAQEAFLRIYNELPQFDSERRFFPWMYRVAQNSCLTQLRRRPRETAPGDDMLDTLSSEHDFADPVRSFDRRESREAVTNAINSLPENYRQPLALRYLSNMTYQEIAQALNVPVSTVETRLFRGRNMLREQLASYIK